MIDEKIARLRQEYGDAPLDPEDLPADPMSAFRLFFDSAVASGLPEPNAMTLATTTPEGPAARVVLLKGADERGFSFYTNYESDKAHELAASPVCALVFSWVEIHRQVRVRGRAEKVPREESEAYFRVRPRESQLGAWASKQSSVLEPSSSTMTRAGASLPRAMASNQSIAQLNRSPTSGKANSATARS